MSRIEKTTMSLKCFLTEKELRETSESMAQSFNALKAEQDGLRSAQTQFKSRIAALEATIGLCAEKISCGYEFRPVECVYEYNYKTGKVLTVRTDTGDIVGTRVMFDNEKQEELQFS